MKRSSRTLPVRFKGIIKTGFILLLILLVSKPGNVRAQPGVDGNLTVPAANTVLNRYTTAVAISANTVTVADITALEDGGSGHYANNALSAGDMILLYQTQGAVFTNTDNTPDYGAFNYNDAGQYEFAVVESVSGNVITVDRSNNAPYSCGGLKMYDGQVQVVRVPQYANLTIQSGASVVSRSWDGSAGGIVALIVQGTATIDGAIDVSGQGFRGGVTDNRDRYPYSGATFVSTNARLGAEKGEGILGFHTEYDASNGRFGRGAPANGGGGGSAHNSGGGGGANGDNGGTWTGSGSPDLSDPDWNDAWDIDDGTADGGVIPAYFVGGSGGGRGGYDYASRNRNALTTPPGDASWRGNHRRQDGGLGGRPVANDPNNRVFFGGGGGSGDGNNRNAGAGGNGGGLVILGAREFAGSGNIFANGAAGGDSGRSDAAGGAGAGGSIVIQAKTVSGVALAADGGHGGNQTWTRRQAEGPGGGGGGGYITIDAESGSLPASVNGGPNGITESALLTEFVPNGATQGYAGATSTTHFIFPGCASPTPVTFRSLNASSVSGVPESLVFALGGLAAGLLAMSILFFRQAKQR